MSFISLFATEIVALPTLERQKMTSSSVSLGTRLEVQLLTNTNSCHCLSFENFSISSNNFSILRHCNTDYEVDIHCI